MTIAAPAAATWLVSAVVSVVRRQWLSSRRPDFIDNHNNNGSGGDDDNQQKTSRDSRAPSLHGVHFSPEQAVGIDIGGTLAKIVYFVPSNEPPGSPEIEAANQRARQYVLQHKEYGTTGSRDVEQEFYSSSLNGVLHFIKFETRRLESALELIKAKGLVHASTKIYGTGGGAVKFQKTFQDVLGVGVRKFDELETLVNGMGFLMYHHPNECYSLQNYRFGANKGEPEKVFRSGRPKYPYLLVNIGTGVSILLVKGEGDFHRVGGTALGGGTFFGLVSLLTGADSFEKAIDLAKHGNHMDVDLLVRDIYGGDYEKFGLRGTIIASSFGKMTRQDHRDKRKKEDLALATLQMVSMNIGVIAHLHAEAHGATCTLFAGNFLQRNPFARRTLAYFTDAASKGKRAALFLTHEGYFGATGALLHHFRDQYSKSHL